MAKSRPIITTSPVLGHNRVQLRQLHSGQAYAVSMAALA